MSSFYAYARIKSLKKDNPPKMRQKDNRVKYSLGWALKKVDKMLDELKRENGYS